MKRLYFACVILLLLFAAALCHTWYLSGFTGELTALLTQAEEQAEQDNWEAASSLTRQALDRWSEKSPYLHILLRHNDIDTIELSFHEVLELIQCQEGGEYSAANARLSTQIYLIYEAEQLTLQNLF